MNAIQIPEVIALMEQWIAEGEQSHYVAVTGMHGVTESNQDAQFKAILEKADLVVPDGMPLVWLGRWHGYGLKRRVYGPELMETFCEKTGAKYRHFFYGGAPGVAESLSQDRTGTAWHPDRGYLLSAISRPDRERTKRSCGNNSGSQAGRFVGGLEHTETRTLDGRIQEQAAGAGSAGRGRGLRSQQRPLEASALPGCGSMASSGSSACWLSRADFGSDTWCKVRSLPGA